MKFKICQKNSKTDETPLRIVANPSSISHIGDGIDRIECPDDPSGHIHYPIPENLRLEVIEYLNNSLLQEKQDSFAKYEVQIREIINKRKQEMIKLRTELNPKILKKLHSFKENNPEFFI